MGLLDNFPKRFGRFMHQTVSGSSSIEVSELDGVRSLHLGNVTVQSAMRVTAPYDLELAYTRGMMAFLLFMPTPREILAIGLGGGSLPKFIRHRMSGVHTTVVEIEPQIVETARNHFYLL